MPKSFIKTFLRIGAIGLFLTGCTLSNNFKNNINSASKLQKENTKVQVTKKYLKVELDREHNITRQTTLEATINSLATQIMRNTKIVTNKPLLITSFVRLDNLAKTTEFGRIISESLINELSNKGFNVIEFRGQLSVSVDKNGEYFISRDISKLKNKVPNTYVLVGTYSRQYGQVVLNVRIIDNISGRIISSSRAIYKHNKKNDCVIFKDCKPPRTINITSS